MFEGLDAQIQARYRSAVSINGDLGVDYAAFEAHLKCIVERYFAGGIGNLALARFVRSLHTDDLLLALACSRASDAAWQRFSALYRKYLADLSRRLTGQGLDPQDLSDAVWIDLFLPDRSGQSRIASYDGRSSLATWLRVIVSNRIVNERLRKGCHFSSLEGIPELVDTNAQHDVEARLRLNRYRSVILQCLQHASLGLSPRDRTILLLRYDQELQLGEIARLFSVHQSTITRQIDRALAKLREEFLALLASEHGLGSEAVQECLSVAFESLSTSVSILTLLRSATTAHGAEPRLSSSIGGLPGA